MSMTLVSSCYSHHVFDVYTRVFVLSGPEVVIFVFSDEHGPFMIHSKMPYSLFFGLEASHTRLKPYTAIPYWGVLQFLMLLPVEPAFLCGEDNSRSTSTSTSTSTTSGF